jgi:hypothetical protein
MALRNTLAHEQSNWCRWCDIIGRLFPRKHRARGASSRMCDARVCMAHGNAVIRNSQSIILAMMILRPWAPYSRIVQIQIQIQIQKVQASPIFTCAVRVVECTCHLAKDLFWVTPETSLHLCFGETRGRFAAIYIGVQEIIGLPTWAAALKSNTALVTLVLSGRGQLRQRLPHNNHHTAIAAAQSAGKLHW